MKCKNVLPECEKLVWVRHVDGRVGLGTLSNSTASWRTWLTAELTEVYYLDCEPDDGYGAFAELDQITDWLPLPDF